MAFNLKNLIRDLGDLIVPQYFNPTTDKYEVLQGSNGAQFVQLSGSNMEYYGATIANRPAANTVPVGSVYQAVNTQEMWQSNGVDWVVL